MASPALLIVFLRTISIILPRRLAQQASFFAFSLTSFLTMGMCAIYGIFASIPLQAVGHGGLSQWTVGRAFKWSMWLITGVSFKVMESGKIVGGRRGGEEALLTRPAVFVGNHQT